MTRSSIALLAFAGASALAAQTKTTTVSVLLPIFRVPMAASVVGAKDDTTTLALQCRPDGPEGECFLQGSSQLVTYGPSTVVMTYSVDGKDEIPAMSQQYNCQLDLKKDSAKCRVTAEGGDMTTSTEIVLPTGLSDEMQSVTITAGLEKLTAAPASAAKATVTSTGSGSGSAEPTEPTGSSASTASDAATATASDNAAGAMVTQNAVLAGVAAVVGGAAMFL